MRRKRRQSEGIKERWGGRGTNFKIQIEDLQSRMLTPVETYWFMHSSMGIDKTQGNGDREGEVREKIEKATGKDREIDVYLRQRKRERRETRDEVDEAEEAESDVARMVAQVSLLPIWSSSLESFGLSSNNGRKKGKIKQKIK